MKFIFALAASLAAQPAVAQDLAQDLAQSATWAACQLAWEDAQAWYAGAPMHFQPGPAFAGLTKHTVLYYNPAIVHTPPAWAVPANQDAVIFDETFFHDGAA